MKQLVKGSTVLTAVSIGEMLMRFVRTKCIAILLGTIGTGFLAQLAIYFETLRTIGDLGSRRAVIKQIAEQKKAGKESAIYKEVVKTSYYLVFFASCLTSFITIIFSPYLSQWVFGNSSYYVYLIVVAALLPLSCLSTVTASIMKGNLDFIPYAKYTLVSYFAVMVITPFVIYFFKYWGAVILYGCFFIFPLAGYLVFNRKTSFIHFGQKLNVPALKEQFRLGFFNIYNDLLQGITKLVIGAWIVKELGFADMGLYQVVITFSTVYLSIPINSITGYSYPLIASSNSFKDITKAVNESLRFLVFLLTPLIIFLMLWPGICIRIFYSGDFVSAAPFLQVHLIGAFFMIMGLAFATAVGAKGNVRAMFVCSTLYPVLMMAFSWLFFNPFRLMGVSIAFTLTNLCVTAAYLIFANHYYEVRILPKNQKLLIATAAWIGFAFWAGISVHQLWIIKIFVVLLIFPWFYLSSKHHERQFLVEKMREIKLRKRFSF